MGESTGNENYTPADLEKWAARIRHILAQADDAERNATSLSGKVDREAAAKLAANWRASAERLIRKFRVAQEHLIATDQISAAPISKQVTISTGGSDFAKFHAYVWHDVAAHTGCRTVAKYAMVEGQLGIIATIVGYESDILIAEGLYQNAWLMMSSRLEPKVDTSVSDEENVYRLRSAGIERNRVAFMLWGSDLGKGGHAAHAKVGRLYAAACAARGEDAGVAGRGVNKEVFREAYARTFCSRYADRLKDARDAVDTSGGVVALHGRKARVDEAFYALFPEHRPETPEEREARLAEEREAAAKKKGKSKAVKPYKGPTKKAVAEYNRRYRSGAARAGSASGEAAANSVDLERTSPRTQRVESERPGTRSASGELGR